MSMIDLSNTNLLSKRDKQNNEILKVLTQTNSIQEISNKNNVLKIKLDKTQFFKKHGEAAVKVEILKNKKKNNEKIQDNEDKEDEIKTALKEGRRIFDDYIKIRLRQQRREKELANDHQIKLAKEVREREFSELTKRIAEEKLRRREISRERIAKKYQYLDVTKEGYALRKRREKQDLEQQKLIETIKRNEEEGKKNREIVKQKWRAELLAARKNEEIARKKYEEGVRLNTARKSSNIAIWPGKQTEKTKLFKSLDSQLNQLNKSEKDRKQNILELEEKRKRESEEKRIKAEKLSETLKEAELGLRMFDYIFSIYSK